MRPVLKKMLYEQLDQLKILKSHISYVYSELEPKIENQELAENLEVALSYLAYSLLSLESAQRMVNEKPTAQD